MMLHLKQWWNNLFFVVLLCVTLGLAPYIPEPHVYGKIKWILGGANGMQMMDYFDFLMHGFPWFLLIRIIILKLKLLFTFKNK